MSASSVLFAGMNVLARAASAHVAWPVVGATRAGIDALVAVGVARARGTSALPKGSTAGWLRSAFGTLAMICTFCALGDPRIPLGDAVTLMNLSPVFLALLAPLVLRERAGRRVALALPLALAGVLLIVRPPALFGGGTRPEMMVPAAIAATGAFFSAFAMMMLRRIGSKETPEAVAAHFSVTAMVTLSVIALLGGAPKMPAPIDLWTMVGTGLCAGLAQLAMTRAYALEMAARVSPFGYLSVVASSLFGAALLGERPDALALGGMALVIAGGIVVAVAGIREQRLSRAVSASLSSGTLGEGASLD